MKKYLSILFTGLVLLLAPIIANATLIKYQSGGYLKPLILDGRYSTFSEFYNDPNTYRSDLGLEAPDKIILYFIEIQKEIALVIDSSGNGAAKIRSSEGDVSLFHHTAYSRYVHGRWGLWNLAWASGNNFLIHSGLNSNIWDITVNYYSYYGKSSEISILSFNDYINPSIIKNHHNPEFTNDLRFSGLYLVPEPLPLAILGLILLFLHRIKVRKNV